MHYRDFNGAMGLSPQYFGKGSKWGHFCSSLDQLDSLQPLLYLPALNTILPLHMPHDTYPLRSLEGCAITQRTERTLISLQEPHQNVVPA